MRKRQLSDDAMGDPFYPMPILTVPFFQGLGFRVYDFWIVCATGRPGYISRSPLGLTNQSMLCRPSALGVGDRNTMNCIY